MVAAWRRCATSEERAASPDTVPRCPGSIGPGSLASGRRRSAGERRGQLILSLPRNAQLARKDYSLINCDHGALASRIVVPGHPHHVTQRGNRREPIFFEAGDEKRYLHLLATEARRRGVSIWAYCLMPNHVHLVLTPTDEAGLARTLGETHRRYTAMINARHGWIGHLFQARFTSTVMDEGHLLTASRYVGLNPVRARLVARAEDWPWSSVRAHLAGKSDGVVVVEPLLSRIDRFADTLEPNGADAPEFTALRMAETAGQPLGDAKFVAEVRQRRAGAGTV